MPVRLALVVIAALLLAPALASQPVVAYSDDLEGDNSDWEHFFFKSLWHFAPDGQCGAVTTMLSWNWGFTGIDCTYGIFSGGGSFFTPDFAMVEPPPYVVSFDYVLDFEDNSDNVLIVIQDADTFDNEYIANKLDFVNDAQAHRVAIDIPPEWGPANVQVGFGVLTFGSTPEGTTGFRVDNIVVTSGGGFLDLGDGTPGTVGEPLLTGTGTLAPNSENQLLLTNALPGAPASLVVGSTPLVAPFAGGTLVPQPELLLALTLDGAGSAALDFRWPPGLPFGTAFYVQAWIEDPGASQGRAASNALRGTSS